jgi:hypothetical protein
MEKDEIVIAMKAYEAGYQQAVDDVSRAFVNWHQKSVEAGAPEIGKQVEEKMKQAKNDYFDALKKGKISI